VTEPSGRATPAGFFEWELSGGLLSDDVVRWAAAAMARYMAGKVSEDDMCLKW
jgi:hypothetical protein